MFAIKAARAFTGESGVGRAEGAYDWAEAGQGNTPQNWGHNERPDAVPAHRGTPETVGNDVMVFHFNDIGPGSLGKHTAAFVAQSDLILSSPVHEPIRTVPAFSAKYPTAPKSSILISILPKLAGHTKPCGLPAMWEKPCSPIYKGTSC